MLLNLRILRRKGGGLSKDPKSNDKYPYKMDPQRRYSERRPCAHGAGRHGATPER